MAKKLPLLISTLIIAASFGCQRASQASAMVITDTGDRAWSIEEMNELYYQFEAEKDVICGQDRDCRRDLGYERSEVDKQYAALQAYSMSSMVLSSINPSQNTVRLYFRDIDFMAMEMEGEERHNPLTEAYVAWLDHDYAGQDYTFVDAMRQDLHPVGLHEIYKADVNSHGENWIPVETEVEISAPDAELELNDSKMIMLFALNAPTSVLSWVYYSSCIDSPNYQSGMECRRMYSENGYVYVPFWPETVGYGAGSASDDSNEDGDIAGNTAGGNGADDLGPSTDSDLAENISLALADSSTDNEKASDSLLLATSESVSREDLKLSSTPSAPNTGSGANVESSTEWWLYAIYGLGLAALVWLFWPLRSKQK